MLHVQQMANAANAKTEFLNAKIIPSTPVAMDNGKPPRLAASLAVLQPQINVQNAETDRKNAIHTIMEVMVLELMSSLVKMAAICP